MIDKFLGSWHINHYVYNPDGAFIGILRELRTLIPQSNERIRVISRCEADAELARHPRHPVQRLQGEWVYEIDVDDDQPQVSLERGYPMVGERVAGKRLTWGWNTVTEHGQWGEFNFTAFSTLISPERQVIVTILEPAGNRKITFIPYKDTHAKMIAIAIPADADSDIHNELPSTDHAIFTGAQRAGEVAELWRGSWQSFNIDGKLEGIQWVERRYAEDGWEEYSDGELIEQIVGSTTFQQNMMRLDRKEAPRHFRRYGWSLEFLAGAFIDFSTEQIEVLDNASQTLVALRRTTYFGNAPLFESRVELALLKPIE